MTNLKAVAIEIWGVTAAEYTAEQVCAALQLAQVMAPALVELAVDKINLRALGGGRIQ